VIHRVFSFADLPCQGRLAGPDGAEIRAPILQMARGKAVLRSDRPFEVGHAVAVQVEFPDGEILSLVARVAESGARGLFLRFEHENEAAERRFGTRLIEASERFQATAQALREEARSGIRNSVLARTRTVDSRDLARRSQHVRVLGMGTITELIESALEEALSSSERALDAEARARILRETEATFHERLATLQAEKAGAEEQIAHLEGELARARSVLEEERARVIENDRFTVSDAGMAELDERLGRLLDRAVRAGGVAADVEAEMRQVVARLLDDERGKIGDQARGAQSDAIELLERKVERLAQTLEKSQKAREIAEHRAAALEAAGGTGFRNVVAAGLHAEDPAREQKLALLREIARENDAVREFLGRTAPAAGSGGEAATAPAPVAAPAPGVKKIAVARTKPPPLTRA